MRASKRRFCSASLTSSQYLISCIPPSTMNSSNSGQVLRNRRYCSSVQKPMTCSTPARLYQLRSKITISPAVGRCPTYRCRYNCPFSRSDGAGNATTRNTRGLTRSVMALIVPPLPAASRPSKITTTRRPSCLTQSCRAQSSTCSLRSDFSYSLRFIGFPPSPSRLFAGGDPQRFRQTPRVIECAVGPAEHVETVARRPSSHSLQCDVLQYLVAAGLALLGEAFRGAFHCPEDGRPRCRLGLFCRIEPFGECFGAFFKAGRGLPIRRLRRHPCEVVIQLV